MWKLKLSSGAFIAPSFVGVLIFFILPFLVVIYYSLVDNPISGNFVFLDNFGAVIRNGAFKKAVHNTLTFSAVAVPLAVALSLLLAIVLEAKLPFRSQFRTFFLSPMMVPVASIVLIWQVLFHYNGAVNDFLGVFGIDKIDWLKSEYAQVVVIILFLWKNLGYNVIQRRYQKGNDARHGEHPHQFSERRLLHKAIVMGLILHGLYAPCPSKMW